MNELVFELGKTPEEDECKAFKKWLAIRERAEEIFKHHKLVAAWFKAGKDETSR